MHRKLFNQIVGPLNFLDNLGWEVGSRRIVANCSQCGKPTNKPLPLEFYDCVWLCMPLFQTISYIYMSHDSHGRAVVWVATWWRFAGKSLGSMMFSAINVHTVVLPSFATFDDTEVHGHREFLWQETTWQPKIGKMTRKTGEIMMNHKFFRCKPGMSNTSLGSIGLAGFAGKWQ